MSRIGWGIVGTGGISRRVIRDLQRVEEAEVVAVASRERSSADAFANEFGVGAAFGDYDEMLASPEVQAVYIGTPHPTHTDLARRAIEAGKHALVEKPFTMSSADARELQQLATERGVFVMEAMWMVFTPGMHRALEIIRSGGIGQPTTVQASMGFAAPPDRMPRLWRAELGGGALWDMGVYTLSLARLILGPPATVEVTGRFVDGVDRFEAITLTHADGALAQVVSSIESSFPARALVSGPTGYLTIDAPFYNTPSMQHAVARPPQPPAIETIEIEIEGGGYTPMFRAATRAMLAGELGCAERPMSETIAVIETMEEAWAQLQA